MIEERKIYFVFAPVFLYWPAEYVKAIHQRGNYKITTGGFIGGPKKYYDLLKEELGNSCDELVYTHVLEEEWINTKVSDEKVQFFMEFLGHETINRIIIADRHIGNAYLFGGNIPSSPMLTDVKTKKESIENYVINMLDYLYGFLIRNKPDLFYSYAVAGAFTLALAELCKKLDIVFTKLSHSRIANFILIDYSPRDEMDKVAKIYLNDKYSYSEESIQFAKTYLKEFREKQNQPDYQVSQNQVYRSKASLKYAIKLFAKWIKGNLDRSNEFYHTSYLASIKYEYQVYKGIKSYWSKKPFFESSNLIDKKFIYYPLHVDPEASTMVVSPYQTNQLAAIEGIAKAKPVDSIVLVKEHLTMIGRRPKGFYGKINQLPGVYMVDPRLPTFEFIKKASVVMTITGTAGLEAVLLKKPAVFLGHFIYKFIDQGFVLTHDLSKLPEILTNLNQIKPATDDSLIKLLASIHECSFPFDGNLIWSGVDKQKVHDNPEVVELFSKKLEELL